jgi:hypothetical protein
MMPPKKKVCSEGRSLSMGETTGIRRHWWRTVERNGRWVSECENCGAQDDIQDLTPFQINELIEKRYQEKCGE